MDDRNLVVFPRGFIGVTNLGLNREKNKETLVDEVIDLRYKKVNTEVDTDAYNLNITKLYGLMIDALINDKLTFNKAIIVEAFRSIGSNDLMDWIKIQKHSRYFTLNHQKFVLDTLKFIQTGKRNTSIRTWEVVLHRKYINDTEHVSNNVKFDSELKSFSQTQLKDGFVMSNSLLRIIPQWLSHRGGNEDLLLTLNIIFGKELNN